MRYVVYGAGAVGGVIGGHLHRAGVPVTLVARGEHLSRIRASGLVLDSHQGRYVVEVPATSTAAEVDWTDDTVVLLTVKSQQTAAALDDLAAHAPSDIVVVSTQNGVANERAILRRFARTCAITVMLPATHLEPGVVVQKSHPTPGILDIGRVPSGSDEVAETVAADLRAAGFESVPRPDIMAWKHRKLLMNLGNGVDAVCAPSDSADELEERARAEGESVVAAAGIPVVSAETDKERRGDILRPRPEGQPPRGGSTWQSLTRQAGSVEIDYLAGEVVLLGRLHGVPTPVNALIQRVVHQVVRDGTAARSLDAADLLTQLRPADPPAD
jgi:2-dehydropantoate 2-reductase